MTITNRFKNVLVLIEHVGGNGKQLKIIYVKNVFLSYGLQYYSWNITRFDHKLWHSDETRPATSCQLERFKTLIFNGISLEMNKSNF